MPADKMRDKHRVHWRDSGKEPECAANPAFPRGAQIDFAYRETGAPGATPVHPFNTPFPPVRAATCEVELPYPARRCGSFVIECTACGLRVACTTAGRPDDPRRARLPCNERPNESPLEGAP